MQESTPIPLGRTAVSSDATLPVETEKSTAESLVASPSEILPDAAQTSLPAVARSAINVIPFRRLRLESRELLLKCQAARGLGPETFFLSKDAPLHLWLAFFIGVAFLIGSVVLGINTLWNDAGMSSSPISNLLSHPLSKMFIVPASSLIALTMMIWTGVIAWEIMGRSQSRLRPFLLITPVQIIQVDYEHGLVVSYRLADASNFKAIKEYTNSQQYKGVRYEFRFDQKLAKLFRVDVVVSLFLRKPAGIESLEAVLAEARALKNNERAQSEAGERFHILPRLAEAQPETKNRPFSRPFSEFWLEALVACALAAVVILLIWLVFVYYKK